MADQGYGADYAYDHNAEDGFSGQNYFPKQWNAPRFMILSSAELNGTYANALNILKNCGPSGTQAIPRCDA